MYLVAIGGVIGSLLRYALGEIFPNHGAGTLWANLLGVAIATHAIVYCERRGNANLRNLLIPGFCGGLTTFSALMLATHQFGYWYLLGTVVASFSFALILVPLARQAFHE